MKIASLVRFSRTALIGSFVLATLADGSLAAQPCPTGSTIPNFRHVSSTRTVPRQVTYAWDAPAGAADGTTYEILRAVSPDYCSSFPGLSVIAETTVQIYTVTLERPDSVYEFWVRVKGCNTGAPVAWIDDSYQTFPSAPVLAVAATAPSEVALSLTQNDSRTAGAVIERAGSDGLFRQIETRSFYDLCPAGSSRLVVDASLAPGTYSYRAWSFNQGTSQQVFSNVVTATVTGSGEPPPVISFYSASPATTSPGEQSTLSWSAIGGTSAAIDQGVGPVPTSGSVVVQPATTTTYTLTVTGPGGTAAGRVQVTVTPIPLPGAVASTIVTVVSTPGLYGAFYRTAVQLTNTSGSLSFGRLVYHPKERSGSDGDSFVRYTLQPRQTLEFANVLVLIGTSGNGSLDVVPEGGSIPVVRARVYNDQGTLGTTGVTEDALPASDALTAGDTAVLLAPSDFRKFRFSVGLRTLAAGATLTFTLRSAEGDVITTRTENLPGTYYIQRSAQDLFGVATFDGNESVTVQVSSGAAFVYATVADNITNDPAIQIARRLP